MRTLRLFLGSLAVLNGAFWLCLVFGFSTLVDPEIQGRDWWRAVFGMMFRAGMGEMAIGLISLVVGIWLILLARRSTTPEP